MPRIIQEFKKKIRRADAILFANPEHNYTISAMLKNAIEWGNRPEDHNSWDGKPAAIISASSGPRGGARAQLNLRQIMVDLNMFPINQPLFPLANAREKFDKSLKLTDPQARKILHSLLIALLEWIWRLQPAHQNVSP